MHDDISVLIDSLRRGDYEDPAEKIRLLAAALREHHADDALLLALLQAPQTPLRLAGLEACRNGQPSPEILAAMERLSGDAEEGVRQRLADVIATLSETLFATTLRALIQDRDDAVRMAAVKTAAVRLEFFDEVCALLLEDTDWQVRDSTARAIAEVDNPGYIAPLFTALAQDDDSDVQRQCARALERWLGRDPAAASERLPDDLEVIAGARQAVDDIYGRFPRLTAWIRERTATIVSPKALEKYGTDLTLLAQSGALPRAYGVEELVETLVGMIDRETPRSIVLLGNAGCGKSALVNELTYTLARPEHGGWHVLRVSPSDFMAGTLYMGEWETKVKEMVEAIRRPRRVLLYVPKLSDLHAAGRWSKSDSNVASALAPYLEDGSVLLLGESTPKEYERGLGGEESLRRLFDPVKVPDADAEQTGAILRAISDAAGAVIEDAVLDGLRELCDHFLGHTARPGNAAVLLRAVIEQADPGAPVALRAVLEALSRSTGIPVDLLDDAQALDAGVVRAFFEGRIIGQPEALDAVVDVVTLIKSGLIDPNKPLGIFLFVGPTGVGKTELARALAEYLFGDPARLLRYDMSEYASNEGFERLIGSSQQNGMLTDAVRQNPFSVVLLDEIEKSHVNVFDLCLQVFDAGRLTDGRGATVDFRRTIVILTSNIGATGAGLRVGFGVDGDEAAPETNADRTLRALSQYFRPEFLNRIDRIVNFRPLSLEVAERIARREVNQVLQRSGITRRRLTIDIDPAVVSLLVKEGYSPYFGARPLKRTVERLLLLPLARVIAAGRIAAGDVLRLTLRDGRIAVQVVPAPSIPTPAQEPAPAALLPDTERLLEAYRALDGPLQALDERKSMLLELTHQSSFYRDAPLRVRTFEEIHRLDRFLEMTGHVGESLERLADRLRQGAPRRGDDAGIRRQLAGLEGQLQQLRFIATCGDAHDLGDAVLQVSLVDRQGKPLDGVRQLAEMYLGVAARWGMQGEVLAEFVDAQTDSIYLRVVGLGAFALLRRESGLHQFTRRSQRHVPRTGQEIHEDEKEFLRVDCLPALEKPDARFIAGVKARVHALRPAWSRLIAGADQHGYLFHEPSLRSLEAWTTGPRAEALERLLYLSYLQVQAADPPPPPAALVRAYQFGAGARVRDIRTGRSTTRLKDVLRGRLELFLFAE